MIFKSINPQQTLDIGKDIGSKLLPGSIIALKGDLAAGKTVFSKGVALSLDIKEDVTSPTYNIINEYPGRIPLFHIDLYRIQDTIELDDIGFDEIVHSNTGVVSIEWPEIIDDPLFSVHLKIQISITDDDSRNFCMIASGRDTINLIRDLS